MQNNRLALDNQWVRIENFQASFIIKKNNQILSILSSSSS